MNREIKFRCYWKGVNKMKHFVMGNFEDTKKYGYVMAFIQQDSDGSIYLGNAEVIQYTGLKDKNGKEIYEHDIILDHVSGKIWVVKFGQAWPYRFTGWYCDYKGEGVQAININNDADDDRNHATEIIGNIYENPELIK